MATVRADSKQHPKLRWLDEARFGVFVHFRLYALPGRGQWVMYQEDIPREEYAALARRFDPRRFRAGEWVDLARAAAVRYLTVTAKHHDGFCLVDSRLTDLTTIAVPYGYLFAEVAGLELRPAAPT
ncbi:MAG: alpha-L-fucosidase [Candidatus Latescibacterota bacterium]